MIGHRLGEFSATRYFRAHSGVAKKDAGGDAGAAPPAAQAKA
jgi:hypothetical protein